MTEHTVAPAAEVLGVPAAGGDWRAALKRAGAQLPYVRRFVEVELAVGHAHEHLDPAGYPEDPAQEEALRDSVGILVAELDGAKVAA